MLKKSGELRKTRKISDRVHRVIPNSHPRDIEPRLMDLDPFGADHSERLDKKHCAMVLIVLLRRFLHRWTDSQNQNQRTADKIWIGRVQLSHSFHCRVERWETLCPNRKVRTQLTKITRGSTISKLLRRIDFQSPCSQYFLL